MPDTLNFQVRVTTSSSREVSVKEWKMVGLRIARAALGRSKARKVSVFGGSIQIDVDEAGDAVVREDGFPS
jgi:hypothetical protein